jgi:hypothetical protein
MTPDKLLAVNKDGLSMEACIEACFEQPELISNFDRLRGTNLSRKGNGLALMINDVCGKSHDDMGKFLDFIYECIFLKL